MVEKNQNIKLIALDMDGTLLTSNQEVAESTQKAIKDAKAKGIQVMLSTGRWLNSCYSYAVDLALDTYLVTSNGGEIWSSDKELVEQHLHDPRTFEEMWRLGNDLGVYMWMVSTEKIYHERPQDFNAHKWLKIGYNSPDEQKIQTIWDQLSSKDSLELTNSLPENIEVNPVGVNKANGIERVCKEIGITMNQVMAIGDGLNDIKMIEQSNIGVAMGNAQDQVKKAADFVTDTNDNDGVAKAFRRFVL